MAFAGPSAGQSYTSCATSAEGSGGTSGLGIGLFLSQESFVEGATVPFGVILYNRDTAAKTLSWGPGETVYSVSVSRDDGTAVETISWSGSDGYAVTIEACSQATLPASSGWNSLGALGDGPSPRTFTFTPSLTKASATWTGAGSIQLYREGGTTSPPPPSPQPYTGSSGCSNYLFVTVGTDKQWYRAGETVTMGVYAYNSADRAITIEYRSGQQYEFRIFDANSRLVATLPEGMAYTAAIVTDELAPGEKLGPYMAHWTFPAASSDSYASGTYFVQGVITTNPECGAKTTTYREYEREAPQPAPTPEPYPFPERPYEYYYEEYRWGDCDPSEVDTPEEWKVCYLAGKERMLAVATDAYRYERGDLVTVTFGNPAPEGIASGPFVLTVADDERNGVFKAEIPEVGSLGPFQRARTSWDGRDADGKPVPGGYYIVSVYGSDGRYGETTVSYGGSRVVFEYETTPWDRPDYLWDDASYRRYAVQYERYAEKWLRVPTPTMGAPADEAYESASIEHEGDLFGSLSCDGASATGRFLAFSYDSTSGQINDFTVNHPALGEAAVLFTTVTIDGFAPATQPPSYGASSVGFENPLCRGPVFLWFGDEQVVDVHNSPTASVGVRSASDALVTFTLLETDTTSAEASRDGRRVEVHVGDVSGWLVLAGPGSLGTAGNVVIADLGAGGQVFFQLEPKGLGAKWAGEREEILRGIANGQVAGELNVDASDGETRDAPVVYHPGVTRFETIAATEGRVQVFIDAESTEGQVVVVNVDKRLLALGQGRTLRVLFDGDAATMADDFDDLVLGGEAKYLFLIGAESVQVLVFIPHFSPHFITLETAVELVTSPQFLQTLAITAGVAFLIVATAAALAFRQPRPKP